MKRARVVGIVAFAIALAAPAHADVDGDFADQLNGYRIYGPRDFNAWMGKIVCQRLNTGVDGDVHKSVDFISANLPRGTTQLQTWQFLAAARDFTPIYYERYIIDKHNKPPGVQQAAMDRAHWFYSLTSADRRAYAEEIATNIYGEPLAFQWPNWAKIFVNNKGVAAKETENCASHPPDDESVWDG